MIVRISKGRFDPQRGDELEKRLREGEATLGPALRRLSGLIHYYVAIDRATGHMTNTSCWDTLDHAMQMASLKEMADQRATFDGLGVSFEAVTNHEVLWEV